MLLFVAVRIGIVPGCGQNIYDATTGRMPGSSGVGRNVALRPFAKHKLGA
jgi:hypothetical protein